MKNQIYYTKTAFDICSAKRNNENQWLPVWLHSADTALSIRWLIDNWLPNSEIYSLSDGMSHDDLYKYTQFLALNHDIGKVNTRFQDKISNGIKQVRDRLQKEKLLPETLKPGAEVRHATVGEAVLINMGCPVRLASIVGAHHGMPSAADTDFERWAEDMICFEIGDGPTENRKHWNDVRRKWLTHTMDLCGLNDLNDIPSSSYQQQVLLTGLLIMADWIASNEEYFPLIDPDDLGIDIDCENRARSALNKLDLPRRWQSMCREMSCESFKGKFGFTPNIVQQTMLEIVETAQEPGVYILSAQMGVGKTEAALAASDVLACRFCEGGLYFALPTQATANGLFSRVEKWAGQAAADGGHTIILAHRNAEANSDYAALLKSDISYEGLFVHQWFTGNKKRLLSDFAVGTIDQLLMASLKQKHLMLRHLALAGKVIVVDECHAYDDYMNTYLDRTIEWLAAYRVPVILLSATLPSTREQEICRAYMKGLGYHKREIVAEERPNRYPLLTWTDGNMIRYRGIKTETPSKTVRMIRETDVETVKSIEEVIAKGGCAGIICNTVSRAHEMCDLLENAVPGTEIMLCHSQFTEEDRGVWENRVLARIGKQSTAETRKGLVVVGTQVLEQSLDIDFDFLATELCPMDLLLQRVGRLHRHDRIRPIGYEMPTCSVMNTDKPDRGSSFVYGDWLLLRTASLLPKTVVIPSDIPDLVEKTYVIDESAIDAGLQTIYDEYKIGKMGQRNRSQGYLINSPEKKNAKHRDLGSPLDKMLDIEAGDEDKSEAGVRDGIMSLEVILLRRTPDGSITFVDGDEEITTRNITDSVINSRIFKQRIKLPAVLTRYWNIEATAKELMDNFEWPEEWKNVNRFAGTQPLFLDGNATAELNGYILHYTKERGMDYIIKEV